MSLSRKSLILAAALLAAPLSAPVAWAQTSPSVNPEKREDRREIREDRRDVREHRREARDGRRDFRAEHGNGSAGANRPARPARN